MQRLKSVLLGAVWKQLNIWLPSIDPMCWCLSFEYDNLTTHQVSGSLLPICCAKLVRALLSGIQPR